MLPSIRSGKHSRALLPFGAYFSPSRLMLVGIVALPLAWYTYVTGFTRWHLRKRNKLWLTYLARLEGSLAADASETATYDSMVEAVRARFGSLRDMFFGRFCNVTYEYREQGVHEYLLHQIIWKPLTGRLFWNGGISDASELDEKLPLEPLDVSRIKRGSWRHKEATRHDPRSSTSAPDSGNTSEEDWEKLGESSRQIRTDSSAKSAMPIEASSSSEVSVTWFGQSTALVQMDGITLLTDPVFADKPMESVLAPRRLRDTPCSLQDLLELDIVDVVLLSHDHFDHCDEGVIRQLGNKVLWIIPLGLGWFFKKLGVDRIREMDWWEEFTLDHPASSRHRDLYKGQGSKESVEGAGTLKVSCTPAQHWSGRTPWGANQSLWCGFVVKSLISGKSMYHCGDTGYSKDLFQAIGKVHGPISLALLPIGAYHPRWIMRTVHTDPEGAVCIHRDLQVEQSIAVHHSTWIMSDERYDEPPKELERQLQAYGIDSSSFRVIPVGRTVGI